MRVHDRGHAVVVDVRGDAAQHALHSDDACCEEWVRTCVRGAPIRGWKARFASSAAAMRVEQSPNSSARMKGVTSSKTGGEGPRKRANTREQGKLWRNRPAISTAKHVKLMGRRRNKNIDRGKKRGGLKRVARTLVLGLVGKHGALNDVADGVHALCRSLEVVVNLDAAGLVRLHSNFLCGRKGRGWRRGSAP